MLTTVLTISSICGMMIVALGMTKYMYDRRRGGANSASLVSMVAAGGLLAGPKVFIPVVLGIADAVINAVASFIAEPGYEPTKKSGLGKAWRRAIGGSDKSSSPATPPATHTPSPSTTHSSAPVQHTDTHVDVGLLLTIAAVIALIVLAAGALFFLAHLRAKTEARRVRHDRFMERVVKARLIGDEASQRWLCYDKDMKALLAAPAMRMWSDPATMAAVEAMGAYDKVSTMAPSRGDDPEYAEKIVSRIEDAASAYASAVEAAERNARGKALDTMPEDQRNALRRAQAAINIALDPAATDDERASALHVVRSTLERLEITPKENLMVEIETTVRKAIAA